MKEKLCRWCSTVKLIDMFYNPGRGKCIECFKKDVKERRQSAEGRDYLRKYSRQRYIKHRSKALARARVRTAVASGRLYKPLNCSNCGLEEQLQAHHEDYERPLEVLWFCDICHKIKHRRIVDKQLLAAKGATHE